MSSARRITKMKMPSHNFFCRLLPIALGVLCTVYFMLHAYERMTRETLKQENRQFFFYLREIEGKMNISQEN